MINSNQTPTHTPVKSHKRLPMIVDIAIDNTGKQLYQVHESSKLVRKQMPKSTNFNSGFNESNYNLMSGGDMMNPANINFDQQDDEKTPIRRILGTISPSTLNQKKSSDSDQEDLSPEQPETSMDHLPQQLNFNGAGDFNSAHFNDQDTDIWSEDVEAAFEEVLSIIPKNGLNKIKISGRSCGRNELISDYILTKTGKFRSRKQVSSHIQVIKNLKQKTDIIKLINDGPVFHTKDEQEQNNKRFEEIFLKINLNKSLGFNDTSAAGAGLKRKISYPGPSNKKVKVNRMNIKIDNFFMSVQDSLNSNPIILTIQSTEEAKTLKLNENAMLSYRFPGLNDLQNSDIPIIHSMVKLQLPDKLPFNYSIEEGLKTNFFVNTADEGSSYKMQKQTLSMFTGIYSYGNEVLKLNDDSFNFNENVPFLMKFWRFFFNQLASKPDSSADALKGITIKQTIYEPTNRSSYHQQHGNVVSKLKIKAVLLWEFAKVDSFKDAVTTTTRLVLPEKKYEEQSVFREQKQTYQPVASATIPQTIVYNVPEATNSLQFALSESSPVVVPMNSIPNTTTTTATNASNNFEVDLSQQALFAPQVRIQRKYINFQQQAHYTSPTAGLSLQQPLPISSSQQYQYYNQNVAPMHPSMNTGLMMPNEQPQDYQFGGLIYPDHDGFVGEQF